MPSADAVKDWVAGFNRGDDVTDIAPIGRAGPVLGSRLGQGEADVVEVALDPTRQRVVGDHVVGRTLGQHVVQLRSSDQRRPLRDAAHLGDELVHVSQRLGADQEITGREVRDDVRRIAALGDDAVDAGVRSNMLPQRVDPVERFDQGVEGVDPIVRIGCRVRGLAAELDPHRLAGERLAAPLDGWAGRLNRPRVGAHRGVDAVEDAGLGHDDLAAHRFLGRGAKHEDRTRNVIDGRLQPDTGPNSRDGDQVVAAPMTEPGQRVVLGEIRHPRASGPHFGPEGGRQAGDASGHRPAPPLQEFGARGARPHFLKGDLRVIVDEFRELDQLSRRCIDRVDDGATNRRDRH